MSEATALAHSELKSADEKKRSLASAITSQVAKGGRVESQGDFNAVIVKGKDVNHVLHLILSLLTFGGWLLVWIALVIFGGENRTMLTIDDYGNTLVQKV